MTTSGTVRDDGKVYLWAADDWVTKEEYDAEMKRRSKWRAVMGDSDEVAAVNNYENYLEGK